MIDKRNEQWAKTRKMGMFSYIVRYGWLMFGGVFFVVSLVSQLLQGADWSVSLIAGRILLGIAAGTIYGWVSWKMNENRFQRDS
ncbi:hypothetical protein [Thalassobacillus pellis]|uniref:hypothetical protein n=1 Tax=Thalassobacillus pellis TaxID=748008 RepID=UPI0019613A93|nr:hypothetical protein [Thalassobacillus pellis]MBM7553487.1 hypothetical protein [Thalassobacillus pellis]